MTSSQSAAGASAPTSLPTRVPPEPGVQAQAATDAPRRSSPIDRSLSPSSRREEGGRSGERDAANGGARSRGQSKNDNADEGLPSEEDGDYESNMGTHHGTPSAQPDEFSLTTVPLDTWVGRYVRITTVRHNGQTGLVHRTGNGWVNLQTAGGEVAKRAYDLLVIPEERANITPVGLDEKGESASRGKRYRCPKDPSSIENAAGSGDDRKASARGRNARTNAPTAHSSSDSSGQDDDDEEEGDEQVNSRPARRRGRAMVDGSDFDEDDDVDEDGDDDGERYDEARSTIQGKPFPSSKQNRAIGRGGGGGGGARERFGGGEGGKESSKSSGRKYAGLDKARGRTKADQDKMRERERGRGIGDQPRDSAGKERDSCRGDNFVSTGKGKVADPDPGASRAKRKDISNPIAPPGDADDKLVSGGTGRERVDRSKDKPGAPGGNKKDEGMKNSWLTQIAKAKDRPNLVRWREELVPITKDSSEDFEDATLSVELMKARCDVCYHEQAGLGVFLENDRYAVDAVANSPAEPSSMENISTTGSPTPTDGDKFCWNDRCWRSPIFFCYFKSGPFGEDDGDGCGIESVSTQRLGYINTFGRETVIDSALTSALQAPVKWLETKRKRKLETHEVFSEDPALYRWQCWASTFPDPNSKDPTYVESKSRGSEKRMKSGHPRNMSGPKISPENKRRGYEGGGGSRMHTNGDVHDEIERSNVEIGRRNKQGLRGSDSPGTRGQDAMDVADNSHMQGDSAGQGAVRRGWH